MSKNALIIGGSSGIGLACVKKLAENQFNVFVIHRDRRQDAFELQETLETLSSKFNVFVQAFNIDATNHEKIGSCLLTLAQRSLGKFDLVLHAISRGNLKSFISEDTQLSAQDLVLTIDAMGINFYTWISKLLDEKLISNGTRIVALTSEGNKKFWEGYGAVASAKAALENISNYLAVELAPKGITVNVIQAGVIDTPSLRLIPGSEKLIAETKIRNPFGRMTNPEDVANFIYLLTLPEAKWLNGTLIHVDGGEHLI
ncbi:MAG: SDR family oxidoreductase [Bacteroidota bacterium]